MAQQLGTFPVNTRVKLTQNAKVIVPPGVSYLAALTRVDILKTDHAQGVTVSLAQCEDCYVLDSSALAELAPNLN
jgi:hypothetical protein